MKLRLLALFFIIFSVASASAQEPQKANPPKSLKTLLAEVNTEWQKQDLLQMPDQVLGEKDETDLVQLHLEQAYHLLIGRTTVHLTKPQKENRLRNLELLKAYAEKKEFPKNTFHEERTPYFVDVYETRCAVAHLVAESGQRDLLQEIKKESNYCYVEELLIEYPSLVDWTNNNGFTKEELKLIQPNYGAFHQEIYPIGNGGGANGVVNILKTSEGGSWLYFAGDFTEIDGVQANSIVRWDGEEWSALGDGVDGEIFDIHFHDNYLHIAGHFKLHGETEWANIAYFTGSEWVALQTGDSGAIYTMETFQQRLHIGGAFESLDGQPKSYLAYYDPDSLAWLNNGLAYANGEIYSVSDVFSADDTVRTMVIFENALMIGGDFTCVMPEVDDVNIIPQDVQFLGRWFGYLWLESVDLKATNYSTEDIENVSLIELYDTTFLVVGKSVGGGNYIFKFYGNDYGYGSFWSPYILNQDNSSYVRGYMKYKDDDFLYGNIRSNTGSQDAGGIDNYGNWGFYDGEFNDVVTAAAVYKDNMYFAGKFTEAFDEPLNGLAYSAWFGQPVSNHDVIVEKKIKIYKTGDQVMVSLKGLTESATFRVFNMQGQLLESVEISNVDELLELDAGTWCAGAYAYQLTGEEGSTEGGTFLVY